MRQARTLALRKEWLGELTPDELSAVVGGTELSRVINPCLTALVKTCDITSQVLTGGCITHTC